MAAGSQAAGSQAAGDQTVAEGALTSSPGGSSSPHSIGNRLVRGLWGLLWILFFRPSPRICWGWRRFLLRCFGARIGRGCRILPSVKIWLPAQLAMDDFACLGDGVDCYCVAPIRLGRYATVSQRAFLCTGSHSITDRQMRLIAEPIQVGDYAWICAEAFVAPGCEIGEGAVVGARAVVTKAVRPWMVVAGNPAREICPRKLEREG